MNDPNSSGAPGGAFNRNFLLLWQGQLVSLVGTQIFRLGLVVWLAHRAQSATLLGLLMATFAVPGLLLGPFGGVLIDRYPRRRILVVCDLLRAAAALSLALLWLTLPPSHPANIGGIFMLAFIVGGTTAIYQPATIAIVPELVTGPGLARANSLVQSSFQIASLAAQSFAGVSFRLVGAPMLALADAATYLYSALSTLLVKAPQAAHAEANTSANAVRPRPSFRSELRAALTYVRSVTGLPALMALSASVRFFVAPFAVLFPLFVVRHLHATSDWYGYLIAGMGLGTLVGMALSGVLTLRPAHAGAAILSALVGQSVSLSALAFVSAPPEAFALVLVSGALNGFISVRLTTMLQVVIAPEMRGRVFSVYRTVTDGLVPIATILAGIVADLLHRNIPLVYLGCGVALIVTCIAAVASRSCRAFLTGGAVRPAMTGRPGLPLDSVRPAGADR